MATTTCIDCGKEASTTLKKCPHCGAKIKRPMSRATKLLLGLGAVSIAAGMVAEKVNEDAGAARLASLSPEQRQLENKAENQSAQRSAAALMTIKTIKRSAHDPGSVQFTSILTNIDGSVVCAELRAKNKLGALVKTYIVRTSTQLRNDDAKAWNKHCTTNLFDLTPITRGVL